MLDPRNGKEDKREGRVGSKRSGKCRKSREGTEGVGSVGEGGGLKEWGVWEKQGGRWKVTSCGGTLPRLHLLQLYELQQASVVSPALIPLSVKWA